MQHEPGRTSGDDELDDERDELADRRHREPRIPRLPSARPEAPREHDQRRRLPPAATFGLWHADLVAFLAADSRAMEAMLDAAWETAAREPADDPWPRLAQTISDCRAVVEEFSDAEELSKFDDWASKAPWLNEFDPWLEHARAVDRLTRDQRYVWLASAFADNETIAKHDVGKSFTEDAVRKHQERVRKQGLHDEDAALEMTDLVALAIRRLGFDVDRLSAAFERVDVLDEEALDAARSNYEMVLLSVMRSLISNA